MHVVYTHDVLHGWGGGGGSEGGEAGGNDFWVAINAQLGRAEESL